MDVNVNLSTGEHRVDTKQNENLEETSVSSVDGRIDDGQAETHANHNLQEKPTNDINIDSLTHNPFFSHTAMDPKYNNESITAMEQVLSEFSNSLADDEDEDDDEDDGEDGADYDMNTGSTHSNAGGGLDLSSMMIPNMTHHSFDDIQFFPSSHRGLRLQPQFQFHQDQLNDPNFHYAPNLSCFDAANLVNLSGSGSVNNSYSLISDSTSGDINSAFSESPFVFPDNVMEYGEPQFFPGNCVGYLETILEEDDEQYEEEEGCSGRHWWTADSDTDTDSVIRVDNNSQAQQQKSTSYQALAPLPGEKDEVKPHFRSSASSRPFELEDLHLFDQLDHAFEETLREPRRRSGFAYGHQSQTVEHPVESNKVKNSLYASTDSLPTIEQSLNGVRCQKSGASDKTATSHSHHVFIESTNNDESKKEMTTKGPKMLTQENVKAHAEENSKTIYEVGEEKEQNGKKLGNAESRETFGSSLSPSSSDSEAPAEVAEEDFFYSSPGSSEEEECRSQEETESDESCSSDDSGKKGVVLAEFSLGSASPNSGGGSANGFSSSSGMMFGNSRSRRSFESPSRLKSFRSFDSLNCLAGTELLFSKPETFPSIHHIKEVSEPGSESESSNEVSVADDRGLIPEEDEEEEKEAKNGMIMTHREGTQSLPSQHSNGSAGFPGPSLTQQIRNKNSVSSSTSTVSSSTSGSGLRSTENLSEDSGIGNDGISSTAASTPGAFIEESNVITGNNGKQTENSTKTISPPITTPTTTVTQECQADVSLLTADTSAKDYISRAEFALNPFVYSSLSSCESSMTSAPSLNCSNNTNVLSQHSSLNSISHLPGKQREESLKACIEGEKVTNQNNSDETAGKTHEFVSDSDERFGKKNEPLNGAKVDATTTVKNVPLLESDRLHPQFNPQTMCTQSTSAEAKDYIPPTLSKPMISDCREDKQELANNSNLPTKTVGQSSVTNAAMAVPSSLASNVNQSATLSTLAAQLPVTTLNRSSTNKTTTIVCHVLANSLVTKQTSPPPHLHVHSSGMHSLETVIDGNMSDEHEHTHPQDNIIPSISSSSKASPPHEKDPSMDVVDKGVSCISSTDSSSPSSKTSSSHLQKKEEEWTQHSNTVKMTETPSHIQGLALNTSKVDAEEAKKHAPLQTSSFPLSSAVDNSFPTCYEDGDEHSQEYSSSSSDEQSENPQPNRFLRQRSDSESEYEAAESAVELNNVDMAYDIIVNSPSKKALAVLGVTGASDVIPAPTSTTSSFHGTSSSLANEQLLNSGIQNTTPTAAPPAEYHSQSQIGMNGNKSGPVSTLSSLISIYHNDMHGSGEQEDNIRNDKRLPLFESSIDDYDDDVIDSAALPMSKNMQATSSSGAIQANNARMAGSTACAHKFPICTTSHEDGGVVKGKQVESSIERAYSTLHNHRVQDENTSPLLHHQLPHQQNKHNHQDQYENSDELTQVPLPQSHIHVACSGGGIDDGGEHRDVIVHHEEKQKRNIFEETQQKHQQHVHMQDQHVLRSVTLDDSTSADVAHNNLQSNQTHYQNSAPTSHPGGVGLKSNHSSFPQTSVVDSEERVELPERESKGYSNPHKLVTAEPHCPNQIGVAEVKTFTQSGYLVPKECISFSGPVEPPTSSSCDAVKESYENNNKQESVSQSAKNLRVSTTANSSFSRAPSSGGPATNNTPNVIQANTTGKERVILGDSNFGFFGCSSHSRSSRGAYESQEPVSPAFPSSSNVFPQVNLDLYSISTSESGFSPGYGFPSSLPTSAKGKDVLSQQDVLLEEQQAKENNTFPPSSIDTVSTSSIKRSSALSSFAPSTKAAHDSSKDISKPAIRKDQQTSKDQRQQQHNQPHLHLEDISLYAGIDKFSIPLGAIKAAVVAVAPTIPSYIVGSSATGEHSNAQTAERNNTSKIPNSTASSTQQHRHNTFIAVEANGNLSTVFPTGAVNKSFNSRSNTDTLPPRIGENNEDKATQPSTSSVPDILIWKQFPSCMPTDSSEREVERKIRERGVMELETATTQSTHRSGDSGKDNIQNCSSDNIESISEMLRSNSPSGSAAPLGIAPLKTKTYGPRNEVEVVVVSSRTPSPAPGFPSTSSSSSSRKLPCSLSSTSSGQERNEPGWAHSSSHLPRTEQESASRESSIPPPPSSPTSKTPLATSTKATRSRVHFSPVVSEISWRESYIDQSSECSSSTEDLLAKLDSCFDGEGNPIVRGGASGSVTKRSALLDDSNSASANLRKAGAAAAAAVVSTGHSGDIKHASADVSSEVGGSAVRPLQVYDIQMSTRAESPSALISSIRGTSPSGKVPILVEKVEMTSSPLHDREEEGDRVLGESQSSRKLLLVADDDGDAVDNDPERVTDLVDFRNNSGADKRNSNSDQNNGTLGLYEDVEVQIEPTAKTHGSTTLSMVPDLLSQCENTNHTHTHIDVRIEETIPSSLNNKTIVLNIGPPNGKDTQQHKKEHHIQPQRTVSKSQSPQPEELSSEPRQILPKMFAEDNKNDIKRNSSSSSSLSSTSKGKKSSKGFLIQGLGSAGKKSDKDNSNSGKEVTNGNGSNTTAPTNPTNNGDNKEKEIGVEAAKENKKSSKPGFFERLSKIRLSGGSKNKKQKVHPKADEIHQEADSSGTPAVTGTTVATNRPLRSANLVNVNGTGTNKNNSTGPNSSSQATNHSGGVQPILKKSTASSSTIPGVGSHYNGKEMGLIGDSENEPDEATQAFENILEEIAGLKSIQLRQEKNSSSSIEKSPSSSQQQQVRSFAKRKQFYSNATSPSPPVSPNSSRSYSDLDSKLSQFKEDTSRTLDAISKSHPDLEIIENAVKQRQKSLSPEPTKHNVGISRPNAATLPKPSSSSTIPSEAVQNSEREWYRLLKSAAEKYSYHKGPKDDHFGGGNALSHKTGIVETDLDTGASREMLDEDMLQLDCKVPCYTVSTSEIPTTAAAALTSVSIVTSAGSPGTAAKTRSLTNLSTRLPLSIATPQFDESTGDLSDSEERAKSLEFLLDENHKSSSVPPENKLRLETRKLSEHELRIQRSLQRLNVPEWYKQHEIISTPANSSIPSSQNKCGTLNISKRSEYGSSSGLAGGWTGLSTYKAPSMSSLQSNGGRSSGTLPLTKSNFIRGRPTTMSVTRTSKESLAASGSASHSPSAFERSSFTYGMPFTMTRFGQGRLSTHSGSVSPPSTPDSTTKISTYVKKPYLGWRSQERLNAAGAASGTGSTGVPKLSIYLPPAERLAADLMATRAKSPHPIVRPPVGDRPPLPKAPPRSEKTVLTTLDSVETPGAHSSSPLISKQASSLAVVTKLPQQSASTHTPEFSHANRESSQSTFKPQSTKVSADVHDSIRQVTTAINHYVNRGQEGQPQQKVKQKTGKKQAIWIESSFVGQKPPSQ